MAVMNSILYAHVSVVRLVMKSRVMRSFIGDRAADEFESASRELTSAAVVDLNRAVRILNRVVTFWYIFFGLSLVFEIAISLTVSRISHLAVYTTGFGAVAALCSIPAGISIGVLVITATRRNRVMAKYGGLYILNTGKQLSRKSEFGMPKAWDFWVCAVIGALFIALGAFGKLGPGGNS